MHSSRKALTAGVWCLSKFSVRVFIKYVLGGYGTLFFRSFIVFLEAEVS
jgi:hypothetical protein